jgi:hypothetical protein
MPLISKSTFLNILRLWSINKGALCVLSPMSDDFLGAQAVNHTCNIVKPCNNWGHKR